VRLRLGAIIALLIVMLMIVGAILLSKSKGDRDENGFTLTKDSIKATNEAVETAIHIPEPSRATWTLDPIRIPTATSAARTLSAQTTKLWFAQTQTTIAHTKTP
jgi:hypothetical protein